MKRIFVPSPIKPASTALIPAPTLTEAQQAALRERMRAARSKGTWAQYASQWGLFEKWCKEKRVIAELANGETVALYLHELAETDCAWSTVNGHRAALSAAFDTAGRSPNPTWDPLVKNIMKAVRRDLGVAARNPKAAATADVMIQILSALDTEHIKTIRDRALLLIGWMGGFRRSALVALEICDVKRMEHGYSVTVRKDKSDQAGEGLVKWIPDGDGGLLDAAAALAAWLKVYGKQLKSAAGSLQPNDPLFPRLRGKKASNWIDEKDGRVIGLGDKSVAVFIKELALKSGIDKKAVRHLAGHSLRAGFVTEASLQGASDAEIMQQTGHASAAMIARYRRTGTPQLGNAAMRLVGRKS
jgi:integrase